MRERLSVAETKIEHLQTQLEEIKFDQRTRHEELVDLISSLGVKIDESKIKVDWVAIAKIGGGVILALAGSGLASALLH